MPLGNDTRDDDAPACDAGRRGALAAGGALAALAALGLAPSPARAAWNRAAFEGKSVAEALRALELETPAASGDLRIVVADVAENGASVPVQIVSRIPNTTRIALMVERNPNALAAVFEVPDGMVPDVATRIRLQESSNVVALAVAGGRAFTATRAVTVTIGGCGG